MNVQEIARTVVLGIVSSLDCIPSTSTKVRLIPDSRLNSRHAYMSGMGQKRSSRSVCRMSAIPPIAEVPARSRHAREVPEADISRRIG
jgi:hypothetical protein